MKRKRASKYIPISTKKIKVDNDNDEHEDIFTIQSANTNDSENCCIICMDLQKDHALIPCGHVCFCTVCYKLNFISCPICNVKIHSILKIYM